MDRVGIKIIASFPDLNAMTTEHRSDDAVEISRPSSLGRLISQAWAFRLLSGLTLLLLVAASLFFGRSNKPADQPPVATATASAKRAPAKPTASTVAKAAAPRPATVVSALPQRSKPPVAVPPPTQPAMARQPSRPANAPQLSSRWPDPAHALSPQNGMAAETPRAASNQPMTVRPAEYEADARAGARSDAPKASIWPNPDKRL